MGEINVRKVKITSNTDISKSFNQHKFISDIYECEKQKYILQNRIKDIDYQIDDKYKPNNFKSSLYYKNYCKEYKHNKEFPRKVSKPDSFIDYGINFTYLSAIAGVVLGLIVDIIIDIAKKDIVIAPGIAIIILGTIIGLGIDIKMYNDELKEYHNYLNNFESTKKYNSDSAKYNNERYKYWKNEFKQNEQKQLNDFIENEEPYLDKEKVAIYEQLDNIESTLSGLYNLRINGVLCLHPNYQGLIPISVIYGYFDTGRCTQLQGHEGAYNLYEDEKMKGMIINKLDVVSRQLGELQSSMVYVGQAIQECNDRLSDLEEASTKMIRAVNNTNNNVSNKFNSVANQLSEISTNTANSSYYAEVGAKMSTFNTVYGLLKD